jgi:hypothetical protein
VGWSAPPCLVGWRGFGFLQNCEELWGCFEGSWWRSLTGTSRGSDAFGFESNRWLSQRSSEAAKRTIPSKSQKAYISRNNRTEKQENAPFWFRNIQNPPRRRSTRWRVESFWIE